MKLYFNTKVFIKINRKYIDNKEITAIQWKNHGNLWKNDKRYVTQYNEKRSSEVKKETVILKVEVEEFKEES